MNPRPVRSATTFTAALVVQLLLLDGCAKPPVMVPTRPAITAPSAITAPPVQAEHREVRRTVVILTRKSGSSVTRFGPNGTLEFAYEHFQNGRGPKVTGRARLGPDGSFVAFSADGKHTLGNPIQERFEIEAGRARWDSLEEQGEKQLEGAAFYAPIAPFPEYVGLLRAAIERAGGKLALLPGGEARVERVGEVTARAAGKEKRLVAWTIHGLEFTPTWLWTEADGSFFGTVDAWYSCVPEGWDEAVESLMAAQKGFDEARDRALAERLRRRPEQGFALTHARVLDVENKRWLADRTVVVKGDRITEVGPTSAIAIPKDALVIDARGRALIPGLWDMHAHLGPPDGILNLASGVTTVRDLGNDPDRLDDFKRRFDEGTAIGPHVLRSGFIEGRGEKAAGARITADNPEEARAAVEFFARRGYEGIKIYNSVRPELVPLLARLAHERKMRVSGHVPMHMLAVDAVEAGFDEIQHVNMIFLNFLADRTTDTRTPLRFSIVAERSAELDLAGKPVRDFFQLLRARKTVVDPTLGVFESLFVARQGQVPETQRSLVERLPVQVQRWFKSGGLVVPPGKDEQYRRAFDKTLEMVKALHDFKIPIVSGTDGIAGLMLLYELEIYARAGIPPADVLHMATLGAARVMQRDRETGSIARGKQADLALVDGDPLASIADLRKVALTVRSGTLYEPAELYAAVGVKPHAAH